MSNDEKRDIEDRINDAMAKIVSDTAGEPQPENKNNRSAAHKSARPSKSARPRKITYVPIDESEFEPIVIPEKKKHKALKVTGMIAAMVLVVAGRFSDGSGGSGEGSFCGYVFYDLSG